MNRKTVCVVVGTRPEAIKMAPVYRSLAGSALLRPQLLSTGQHREMLDQTLRVFDLNSDYDLRLMEPDQGLSTLTSRAISAVSEHFENHRPDAVLVQGDTTTVLAASIAAFYARIPVGHVEAGLRTGDMDSPWPEEMNRRLTTPLCRWHFAPTEQSRVNLLKENISPDRCYVTGNTVIDALLWMRNRTRESGQSVKEICSRLGVTDAFQNAYFNEANKRFVLVTGHRRESFGAGFKDLCTALLSMLEQHPDLGIVYPVHLNPAARIPVLEFLGGHSRISLIEPVSYRDFVWLMDRCYFVISDSGGVQEEAPSLGKPVLVTREKTERPEGVAAGTCELVGTSPAHIASSALQLLNNPSEYARRSRLANPYGDGNASERICKHLEETLCP